MRLVEMNLNLFNFEGIDRWLTVYPRTFYTIYQLKIVRSKLKLNKANRVRHGEYTLVDLKDQLVSIRMHHFIHLFIYFHCTVSYAIHCNCSTRPI